MPCSYLFFSKLINTVIADMRSVLAETCYMFLSITQDVSTDSLRTASIRSCLLCGIPLCEHSKILYSIFTLLSSHSVRIFSDIRVSLVANVVSNMR